LRRSSSASIINISATLHLYATHYQAHASAAKAAIDSLTRSLSLEWSPLGIRVNGVAPGAIADTPGSAKLSWAMTEEDRVAAIPMGREGERWDIAMMVLMLVGEGGRWVSGQTVVVDGGALNYRQPWASKEQVRQLSKQVEAKSRKEEGANLKAKM
jgi:peroxisomal 2,4-dienoyl-CoA reductase